jgi:hypothetical protein
MQPEDLTGGRRVLSAQAKAQGKKGRPSEAAAAEIRQLRERKQLFLCSLSDEKRAFAQRSTQGQVILSASPLGAV